MPLTKIIRKAIKGHSPVSYPMLQVGEEKVRQNPGSPLFLAPFGAGTVLSPNSAQHLSSACAWVRMISGTLERLPMVG
jgi:hypothetical protein